MENAIYQIQSGELTQAFELLFWPSFFLGFLTAIPVWWIFVELCYQPLRGIHQTLIHRLATRRGFKCYCDDCGIQRQVDGYGINND